MLLVGGKWDKDSLDPNPGKGEFPVYSSEN